MNRTVWIVAAVLPVSWVSMAIHATRLDLSAELSRGSYVPAASAPSMSRTGAAGHDEASVSGRGDMPAPEPEVIPVARPPEMRPTSMAPADSRVGPGGYSSYSSVSLTTTLY